MSTTALGRRSRARSGLGQVDAAEDLVAVVAAAVAVDVPRAVVHVLDHGRAADRRVAVYVVLLRRPAIQNFLDVVPARRPRRVDGVGRPKFYFHAGST